MEDVKGLLQKEKKRPWGGRVVSGTTRGNFMTPGGKLAVSSSCKQQQHEADRRVFSVTAALGTSIAVPRLCSRASVGHDMRFHFSFSNNHVCFSLCTFSVIIIIICCI